MTARDAIAQAMRDDFGPFCPSAPGIYADKLISALTAAGFTIVTIGGVEADGWQPIETAPNGRCLMWVADSGERGAGQAVFGTVYVWPDARSYRPDGHHGDWNVTHWQPLPAAPLSSRPKGGA